MSRNYAATQYDYLSYAGLTSLPIALFVCTQLDNTTADMIVHSMSKLSAVDSLYMNSARGATDDKFFMRNSNNTTNTSVSSAATFTTGVWYGLLYEMHTAGGFNLWSGVMGAAATVASVSGVTFPNGQQPDRFSLAGYFASSAFTQSLLGRCAKWAVWSGQPVAWTQQQADMLVRGFSPQKVRPQWLIAYRDFINDTNDRRFPTMGALTSVNTPTDSSNNPIFLGAR